MAWAGPGTGRGWRSFGQQVQMSVDQFRKLAAERASGRFQALASL
jgi:heme oxygenase